jgi:hypothetical protein
LRSANEKKFNTWLAILILAIIAILGYSYFLKYFNETKQKIDFYGCQTNLTKFYIKRTYHCGDLQEDINYKEHTVMIQCLCKNYEGNTLTSKLSEYLEKYATNSQKEELVRDSKNLYDSWNETDPKFADTTKYYGYNPLEKPPLCSFMRFGCA